MQRRAPARQNAMRTRSYLHKKCGDIGGSPQILMESELIDPSSNMDTEPASDEIPSDEKLGAPVGEAKTAALPEAVTRLPDSRPNIAPSTTSQSPWPIFVGHGKNKGQPGTSNLPKSQGHYRGVWFSDLDLHSRRTVLRQGRQRNLAPKRECRIRTRGDFVRVPIEFDSNDLQARTADLLKELIGFGLVRVTPT
jgi:hypothetical protein